MSERESRELDPARASGLDAAGRDIYVPDWTVVDLLELQGEETVVDYGAGTGRVAAAVAARHFVRSTLGIRIVMKRRRAQQR